MSACCGSYANLQTEYTLACSAAQWGPVASEFCVELFHAMREQKGGSTWLDVLGHGGSKFTTGVEMAVMV